MKYVIIGNSAAGISAAEVIRKNDSKGTITIISDEPFNTYSRPLISYYLKNKVAKERMYFRDEKFYEKMNIDTVLGKKVVRIDVETKKVIMEDDTFFKYDRLLLANGSVPFVPPIENLNNQGNVFSFMKWQDSIEIKEYAKKEHKVVIIGGGLIGLKAAEGIHSTCEDVTAIDLASKLLTTILDDKAGEMVSNHIINNGIKCLLNDTVVSVQGTDKVESVTLKSGAVLPCDLLVLAVGVRPNTALALTAGIKVSRGVMTDNYMLSSVENIYAAGDVSESYDILDGVSKVLALWPNAVYQGKVAGDQMSDGKTTYDGGFAMNAIDFFGMRIMTCGLINPPEDEYEIATYVEDGKYKKLVVKNDQLKGFILMNYPHRAGIYTSLVRNGDKLSELNGNVIDDIGLLNFTPEQRKIKIFGSDIK